MLNIRLIIFWVKTKYIVESSGELKSSIVEAFVGLKPIIV